MWRWLFDSVKLVIGTLKLHIRQVEWQIRRCKTGIRQSQTWYSALRIYIFQLYIMIRWTYCLFVTRAEKTSERSASFPTSRAGQQETAASRYLITLSLAGDTNILCYSLATWRLTVWVNGKHFIDSLSYWSARKKSQIEWRYIWSQLCSFTLHDLASCHLERDDRKR